METQTCPGRAWRQAEGSIPNCNRARGRALSTTISAHAISSRSRRIPACCPRSTATLCLPALSKSKNRGSPRRAPSGRSRLSSLITRAPLLPSSWAQSGPAQSAERSRTWGLSPGRGGGRLGPTDSARSHGASVAGAPNAGATASPIMRPRSTQPRMERRRRTRAAKFQASSPGAGSASSQAGNRSRSSGRARLRASQASRAAMSRQPPPGAMAPRRSSCIRAARSPSRAGPSSSARLRLPGAKAARARAAPRATEASGPGARRGGPSASPVNAMAPERAHSRAESSARLGIARIGARPGGAWHSASKFSA